MANIFHAPYTVTQPYAYTQLDSEPPITLNGVYYPHFHRGIDLVGPSNTCPIYAAVPGVVYAAGKDTDGAIYCIEHADDGHWVYYWHLSKLTVKSGDRLDATTQIGDQGMTGNATGYHCHFEVDLPGPWLGGTLKMTPTDPTPYLSDQGGYDMDPTQIAKDLYLVFDGHVPTDDILQQKADFIAATGNIQQVALDIAEAGGWLSNRDWNHAALKSYRDAFGIPNDNPDQWATDRLNGGVNFDQQVHAELPSILTASAKANDVQQQLTDANQEISQSETIIAELHKQIDNDAPGEPLGYKQQIAGLQASNEDLDNKLKACQNATPAPTAPPASTPPAQPTPSLPSLGAELVAIFQAVSRLFKEVK